MPNRDGRRWHQLLYSSIVCGLTANRGGGRCDCRCIYMLYIYGGGKPILWSNYLLHITLYLPHVFCCVYIYISAELAESPETELPWLFASPQSYNEVVCYRIYIPRYILCCITQPYRDGSRYYVVIISIVVVGMYTIVNVYYI